MGNDVEPATNSATGVTRSMWRDMEAHLQQQKARLYDEIKNYPTPIAGCDQQFNHLLESRAAITRELNRLQGAAAKELPPCGVIQAFITFVQSSGLIDAELRGQVLSKINRLVAKCYTTGDAEEMRNAK